MAMFVDGGVNGRKRLADAQGCTETHRVAQIRTKSHEVSQTRTRLHKFDQTRTTLLKQLGKGYFCPKNGVIAGGRGLGRLALIGIREWALRAVRGCRKRVLGCLLVLLLTCCCTRMLPLPLSGRGSSRTRSRCVRTRTAGPSCSRKGMRHDGME